MMPLEMQKYHTMIDPFLAQRLKKGEPYNYNNYKGIPWIYRALDKKTPTTQANSTRIFFHNLCMPNDIASFITS